MDASDKTRTGGTWFPGAVLNIAECCLLPTVRPRKGDDNLAMIWREEDDDTVLRSMTLKQLREQVMYGLDLWSTSHQNAQRDMKIFCNP